MKHAFKVRTLPPQRDPAEGGKMSKLKIKSKQSQNNRLSQRHKFNLTGWIKNHGLKAFPTFISSIPHQKKVIKKTLFFNFYVGLSALLLINIVLSQTVNPAYFQLVMNDDEKAVIYYLQSIRQSREFPYEFAKFKKVYGNHLETTLSTKESVQKNMIQQFEQMLQHNQFSRDILYGLFLLNENLGNKKIAQEYLLRAKTVDPTIRE